MGCWKGGAVYWMWGRPVFFDCGHDGGYMGLECCGGAVLCVTVRI